VGSALASDRVLPRTGSFETGPAVVSTTSTVFPQIQPIRAATKLIEENEPTTVSNLDPINSLVPGHLMTTPRGTPKVGFTGPGFTGYFPPDCDMGVGPGHVVAVVNLRIAIFTKTGTKTFEQDMDENGFWSGIGGASQIYSDPKVFYDSVTQRWFVYMIEVNGLGGGTAKSKVLLAVSDDNNPNGTWFKYALEAQITVGGNALWLDYPTVGMNKDGIAIGGNMFGFTAGGGVSQIIVVPKAPLLSGGSATVNSFQDTLAGTIQPARSGDPTSDKLYCMATGNGSTVRVYAIRNITSTPTVVSTTVNVPTYEGSSDAPSSGGNQLDTLGSRMFNCMFRSGKLVAAHTITTSGNATNRVRWYQVAVNNWPTSGAPTLVQSGDINNGSNHTHMGAIAVNANDDISVIYTRSSNTITADMVMSSRKTTDPLGSLGAPVVLRTSSGSYALNRWGDYFSCAVDPVDDQTFWGFGMQAAGGAWVTSVHSWVVTLGGGAGATTVNADSINTTIGSYIIGDPVSISTSDDLFYQIGSIGIPQFGQSAGAEAVFTVPGGTTQITLKQESVAGVVGGTTMIWLWNWQTGQYVLIGSSPIQASGNLARTLAVRATDVPKYMNGTNQVKALIRGHLPFRPFQNTMPNPFTYKVDLFQLLVR
jgi:hypothetical protein